MDYKSEIMKMLNSVKNAGTMEYLWKFIKLFLEKWGT